MYRYVKKLKDCTGTTLVELMVALVLTGIITAAILGVYSAQHQNYDVQDDVVTIQQNARVVIDELTRQIRVAGYDLPVGLSALTAKDGNPDSLTVTYFVSGCESYLSADMAQPTSELNCGSDVSCFKPDQWVYIFHPDSGGGEFFEISGVETASSRIQPTATSLSQAYTTDAIVMGVDQVTFFVNPNYNDRGPMLMQQIVGQNPQPYAENISDLQFRYRLANGTIVDEPVLITDVREVLIDVIGQSDHPLDGDNGSPSRSRTFSSSVNVRNLSN